MSKKTSFLASWSPNPPHRDGERRFAMANSGELARMASNRATYPDLRIHDNPGKGKKVSVEIKIREL